MRIRNVVGCVLVAVVVVLACGYVMLFLPLPPERILKSAVSPDGFRTATYSWRASGILGIYSKEGAHVYLTIRDRSTGQIIARHAAFADVPDEAESRLGAVKPW